MKKWIKQHKKEILIGAGLTSVIVVGGAVTYKLMGCGGTKAVMEVAEGAEKIVQPKTFRQVTVVQHVRNLPSGWNPSAEKIAEAAQKGIELAEGQTLVSSFPRMIAA